MNVPVLFQTSLGLQWPQTYAGQGKTKPSLQAWKRIELSMGGLRHGQATLAFNNNNLWRHAIVQRSTIKGNPQGILTYKCREWASNCTNMEREENSSQQTKYCSNWYVYKYIKPQEFMYLPRKIIHLKITASLSFKCMYFSRLVKLSIITLLQC